ncbi:hypothetical protein GCM10027343_10850 [Noviherbaspirillum agri]
MKKIIPALLLTICALAFAGNSGEPVMVDWKGTPYKAFILKSEGGRHYVHYDGWPSSYDEWISDSQIIGPKGQSAPSLQRQGVQSVQPRPVPHQSGADAGKQVWVLWHGKPYKAVIHKSEGGRHFVSYPGWPSNYDEWISNAQIIDEEKARKIAASQSGKRQAGAAPAQDAQGNAYKTMDAMRENGNRLHQETMQQYRDTENHYERRRQYGY